MASLCAFCLLLHIWFTAAEVQYRAKFRHHPRKVLVEGDHTVVRDSRAFPFMAAVLYKDSFISAGALISEVWVVTCAESLYLKRGTRLLRVRLGSTNYKKDGSLIPIKLFEIHPYFDDIQPYFDVALIKLAQPIQFTRTISPIRVLTRQNEVNAIHFIVTTWTMNKHFSLPSTSVNVVGQARRWLLMTQFHMADVDTCDDALDADNSTELVLCLDPTADMDPCQRDSGAAVVYDGQLLGVMSSWASEDCKTRSSPAVAVRLSSPDVASWIRNVSRGFTWIPSGTHPLMSLIEKK